MCGITGWIDWHQDLSLHKETTDQMMRTLIHRGPDGEGAWLTKHAFLGHRRLAVIDPSGGQQPMIRRYGDNTYVIVYNGELYNTEEIRRDLQSRGYIFRTHSDTEVLLIAYVEWGPQCLDRLNGIFAFAVWCEHDQRLFLARDRLGVKPLFYCQQGTSFLFASELKSLLANPLVQPQLDEQGLAEIFALGPGRTPGCGVFRGVCELKPGCAGVLDHGGFRSYTYWSLKSGEHRDTPSQTIETIRFLLQDSIERQMVSDVPICTLLSGGLDSSIISAYASQKLSRDRMQPLHTFSVDYVDNRLYFQPSAFQPNSDADWVPVVAAHIRSEHHPVLIDTPQLAEALIDAMRARDLPGMADVDSSLYLFFKEVRKHATVALSGECADEVFGGYPWFHRLDARNARTFPWSLKIEERLQVLSPDIVEDINPARYLTERYHEAIAQVPRLPGEDPEEARIRELFYLNLYHWMPVLLDRKDRMSMAVGLEVRVPFCDHRLVEYLWNVPWSMKTTGDMPKGILRQAVQDLLPAGVVWRRKSPYPKTHNPSYHNLVRGWLLQILQDPSSPILPLVNRQLLVKMAEAEEATQFDIPWFGQLMNVPQLFAYLIQVDAWLRDYRITIR